MSASPSLPIRLKRTLVRVRRTAGRVLFGHGTVYVDQRLSEYRRYWEQAAAALGAEFHELRPDLWEVRLHGRTTRLSNHLVPLDDPVTLHAAGDKELCYTLAGELGVQTPPHVVFTLGELERAQEFLKAHEVPLVLKPVQGSSSGIGITTHIRDASALERAACLASLFSDRLLLETMIFGESYRLLYLDGRFLHAVRRRGVRVRGDGRSALRALLAAAVPAQIAHDSTTRETLRAQGLELDSVPAAGAEVLARSLPAEIERNREIRTVYDEAATGLISEAVRDDGLRMVEAVGARFAGVDIVTRDPALPLGACGGAFIEVNTTPGIHHHYVPGDEQDRPVAVDVLGRLLEEPGTAPVASVPSAATSTKTTTG